MRVVSWWLAAALAAMVIACGGGGEEKQATAKKPEQEAPAAAPAATGGYQVMAVANGGSVTGKVTYGGTAPERKKLPVTKDTQVCGLAEHYDESLEVGSGGGIQDVVVSIRNIRSGKAMDALGSSFVLTQKGCKYSPHISIVPVNASLKILNPDGILHNIHTYSEKNPAFNKSQPKFKQEMEASFSQPEVITAKCDVHGWMDARIIVVDHPYYAKSDAGGSYTLADVPPGEYEVEFWQEKLGTHTMKVAVAGGTSTTLDYTYPASPVSN